MKKLHIGVGGNFLVNRVHNPSKRIMSDWIETDIVPPRHTNPDVTQHIMKMDATKPFPFEDASFDYVFSEHMIEHVVYDDGVKLPMPHPKA